MAAGGHFGFSKLRSFRCALISFIFFFSSYIGETGCFLVYTLGFNSINIKLTFLRNPIWPPAAILNFNSKLIFDDRNDFSRTKSYENHVLYKCLQISRAWDYTTPIFNMASGGHLGFFKMCVFLPCFFRFI